MHIICLFRERRHWKFSAYFLDLGRWKQCSFECVSVLVIAIYFQPWLVRSRWDDKVLSRWSGKRYNIVLVIKRLWPSNKKRIGSSILAREMYRVFQKRKKEQSGSDNAIPTQRRRSIIKLKDCMFFLEGREFARGKWMMSVTYEKHNHDHSDIMLGHAYRGWVKGKAKEVVKLLSAHGTQAKPILSFLHEIEEDCMTSRK